MGSLYGCLFFCVRAQGGAALSRTIVYIDGFNLYYGAVKYSSYKWLNIQRFFTLLRPADDLRRIYYFTALIDGLHRPNQVSYLKALETLPLVTVALGKFKAKQVRCLVGACKYQGDRTFNMPEEKRTDVNIAVQMLQDAHKDNCDRFVVVSGDSGPGSGRQSDEKHLPQEESICLCAGT